MALLADRAPTRAGVWDRPSRRLPVLAAVGAVVLALVVGLLAGRDRPAPPAPAVPAVPAAVAAPTGLGPADAAVVLIRTLTDPALLDPIARDAALARVAVTSAVPVLRERFTTSADDPATAALAASVARGGLARVVPVGVQVLSADEVGASVDVWVVAVTAAAGLPSAVQSWSTETLTLRRTTLAAGVGGWLLAGYASRPGPAPAATQDPADPAAVLAVAGTPAGGGPGAR